MNWNASRKGREARLTADLQQAARRPVRLADPVHRGAPPTDQRIVFK
jgi:hypothetical protein